MRTAAATMSGAPQGETSCVGSAPAKYSLPIICSNPSAHASSAIAALAPMASATICWPAGGGAPVQLTRSRRASSCMAHHCASGIVWCMCVTCSSPDGHAEQLGGEPRVAEPWARAQLYLALGAPRGSRPLLHRRVRARNRRVPVDVVLPAVRALVPLEYLAVVTARQSKREQVQPLAPERPHGHAYGVAVKLLLAHLKEHRSAHARRAVKLRVRAHRKKQHTVFRALRIQDVPRRKAHLHVRVVVLYCAPPVTVIAAVKGKAAHKHEAHAVLERLRKQMIDAW